MVFTKSRNDVLFVYAAYCLRYIYLILLIPFYARVLGVEGYGVVLAALSLMQMAWVLTDWGFNTTGLREVATAKPTDYPRIFGSHISARLFMSIIAFTLGLIAIYFSRVLSVHYWVGLCGLVLGIFSAFNLGWYFAGTERPRNSVKLEVLGFAISLSLILSLVNDPNDSLIAVGSLLISGSIGLFAAFWWVRKEVSGFEINLKQGARFVGSTQSMFVLSSSALLLSASSTYLLSALVSHHEVGLYGSAERLVAAGISLMSPLSTVFSPKVTKLFKENALQAYRLVRQISLVLLSINTLGALISYFYADLVIGLIFGEAFSGSVPILQTFALIFPIQMVITLLGGYVLVPLHHERYLAKAVILGAILNIAIAFPLVNIYSGVGMALAAVISKLLIMLAIFVYCYRLGVFKTLLNSRS